MQTLTKEMFEKMVENLRLLNEGKLLYDKQNDEAVKLIEFVMEDHMEQGYGYSLEQFSKLELYISPKTTEELLKERIVELEALVAAKPNFGGPVVRKDRSVLSKPDQLIIAQFYKRDRASEKPLNILQTAAKYNISPSYLSKMLKEHGVYEPRKRKQKVNAHVEQAVSDVS